MNFDKSNDKQRVDISDKLVQRKKPWPCENVNLFEFHTDRTIIVIIYVIITVVIFQHHPIICGQGRTFARKQICIGRRNELFITGLQA
jgi:hypothetical protein